MNNKLIIFSHYYFDANILNRYQLLKYLNPDWDIIPVGFEDHSSNLISNSLVIDTKKYPDNREVTRARPDTANVNWTQADLFFYEIYLEYPKYDKYFLFEYDTIFNCSIEDFFPSINTYNHFGTNTYNNISSEWGFYTIYKTYNSESINLEQLSSIGQTTCIYIDNKLLSLATNEIIKNKNKYNQMFSELRLGTIIKKFNKKLLPSRSDINEYISWDNENIKIDLHKQQYFYHPYK